MKKMVERITDTAAINSINPQWPKEIVSFTVIAEIKGNLQGIWVDNKCIGFVGHDGWRIAGT